MEPTMARSSAMRNTAATSTAGSWRPYQQYRLANVKHVLSLNHALCDSRHASSLRTFRIISFTGERLHYFRTGAEARLVLLMRPLRCGSEKSSCSSRGRDSQTRTTQRRRGNVAAAEIRRREPSISQLTKSHPQVLRD